MLPPQRSDNRSWILPVIFTLTCIKILMVRHLIQEPDGSSPPQRTIVFFSSLIPLESSGFHGNLDDKKGGFSRASESDTAKRPWCGERWSI